LSRPAAPEGVRLSVIVPVRDAAVQLEDCLTALARCEGPPREVIVVDDGSRDDPAAVAAAHGARLVRTAGEGPAAARNAGARAARGELLFFLDADCRAQPSTLTTATRALDRPPAADAVFGSYDDEPAAPGVVSQFKNLHHHWVHQQGEEEAGTFWSGCGVVRRAAFEAVGGFDAGRFRVPSIEDVELGRRLRAAGYRIRLEKRLQVKHLKSWSLKEVITSDVTARAAPWMELLLEGRAPGAQLNVKPSQLAAAAIGLPFPLALPALQPGFYRFLARRRGVRFALAAWPLHWLYFVSAAAGAALGASRFGARRAKRLLSSS
jgi:cellulose synthase/poly-beta-1,6-N-acetylglucosamine synthase-like glycosyltransferase